MRKQNKNQEVKCLFDHHDWRWSLTEKAESTFIITAICRQCRKKSSEKIKVFCLADAFIEFGNRTIKSIAKASGKS